MLAQSGITVVIIGVLDADHLACRSLSLDVAFQQLGGIILVDDVRNAGP